MSLKRLILACLALLIAGCGQEATEKENPEYTKGEAAALSGTLPDGRDLCDVENWYGDGECDSFCPLTDSDCACQADSECSTGEVCTNGECGQAPLPACSTDADCLVDSVCVNGQCETDDSAQCAADADCPADHFCSADGACLPREVAPPQCRADSDCAAEEVCVDGECETAQTPACTSDADCLAGEFCGVNGECLPREMAPPQCQDDSDCAIGELCVDNECEAEQAPDICQSNDDCDAGEMCDDTSRCVDWVCGGFAGFQCPDTHYCDFDESVGTACGAADGTGICTPRPQVCNTRFDPVCGCDGMEYGNACEGYAAGTDYWTKGSCRP